MKKLILTSVAALSCMAIAPSSHAQGTVNFNSSLSPTPCITSNTLTGATAKITTPSQYTFGIYFASTAAGLATSLTPVISLQGVGFAGGISLNSTLAIPNIPQGTFFFEVKGWTTAAGSTYEAAATSTLANAVEGTSSIGQVTLGHDNISAGQIFGTAAGQVADPILTPVPEPSTMVLGGLGVAALAFFRRRK